MYLSSIIFYKIKPEFDRQNFRFDYIFDKVYFNNFRIILHHYRHFSSRLMSRRLHFHLDFQRQRLPVYMPTDNYFQTYRYIIYLNNKFIFLKKIIFIMVIILTMHWPCRVTAAMFHCSQISGHDNLDYWHDGPAGKLLAFLIVNV